MIAVITGRTVLEIEEGSGDEIDESKERNNLTSRIKLALSFRSNFSKSAPTFAFAFAGKAEGTTSANRQSRKRVDRYPPFMDQNRQCLGSTGNSFPRSSIILFRTL